eukprot:3199170-Pyramimonas_sp.AAC.3
MECGTKERTRKCSNSESEGTTTTGEDARNGGKEARGARRKRGRSKRGRRGEGIRKRMRRREKEEEEE